MDGAVSFPIRVVGKEIVDGGGGEFMRGAEPAARRSPAGPTIGRIDKQRSKHGEWAQAGIQRRPRHRPP